MSLLLASLLLLSTSRCSTAALPLLTVNSTLLHHSGDEVLVSWSSMQASASDNISVVANGLIILEFSVTASPSWSQGSGSLSVRLVNIYAPLIITYASLLGVLAQSPPIIFSDPYEPLFPRLSLLGDTNSTLVITWTCSRFTGDERVLLRPNHCSSCQYKDFPLLPGGNVTYGIDAMCGGVAKGKGWLFPLISSCTQTSPQHFSASERRAGWLEPGWQLSAALYDLEPGSEYEYMFGAPGSMSSVMVLRAPSGPSANIHVYLFGDMGVAAAPPNGFPASLSTVNSIRNAAANASAGDYTSVLHIGDISYAMGYQFYWPLFLDQIQPIASRAPYLLSIGPPPPSSSSFLPPPSAAAYPHRQITNSFPF
jgi:hypothetical protein